MSIYIYIYIYRKISGYQLKFFRYQYHLHRRTCFLWDHPNCSLDHLVPPWIRCSTPLPSGVARTHLLWFPRGFKVGVSKSSNPKKTSKNWFIFPGRRSGLEHLPAKSWDGKTRWQQIQQKSSKHSWVTSTQFDLSSFRVSQWVDMIVFSCSCQGLSKMGYSTLVHRSIIIVPSKRCHS